MKLLKILLIFLIVILLIIGIPVGIIYYSISDKTDETPIELYEPTLTTDEVINPLIKKTFDEMEDNYALNLGLTEDDLNKLIYSLIKEKVNTEYNPKYGASDQQIYLNSAFTIPNNVDLLSGKKIIFKSLYATYENDNIYLNLTIDGLGLVKSRIVIGFCVETTDKDFILNITEAKLGKISLLKGLGKTILNSVILKNFLNEESLNTSFKEKGLPLNIDLQNLRLISNKDQFGEWINKTINNPENPDNTISSFLDILTNSENNMINLSTANDKLNLKIDLDLLKVDEADLIIPDEIKHDIDFLNFAQSKAQNIVFNMLSSSDKKILFTELEFNELIYTETQHYQLLTLETTILDDVAFNFKIEGILVDITEEYFNIKLILNINDLKTIAILECPISYSDVSHTEIHINVPETITLGNNLKVDSSFIISLLDSTMRDNNVMPFVNETGDHYFKLTAQVFDSFVNNANAQTPLHVTKIEFINGSLDVYVECTDTTITDLLDTVTTQIEEVLKSDFIDNVEFDTTDAKQAQAVNNITESVDSIASILSDPNQQLSQEDTNKLLTDFNSLSTENQNLFLSAIQDKFETADGNNFSDLYNSLFN